MCAEVFHALQAILKSRGLAASVGDEGGFAPDLAGDEEAIETILAAVERAGYRPGADFMLALDAAASTSCLRWTPPPASGRTPPAAKAITSCPRAAPPIQPAA